jgi:two-component system, sensor histidine kinase
MGGLNKNDPPRGKSGWPSLRWLSRVFVDDVLAGPDPSPVAKHLNDDSHRGKLRVLVVDDNPVNLMVASEMLSAWGIDALLAADGAEAVAIAGESQLDLILMDLQMPVLDGLASARQIRDVEREFTGRRVPIVAYTTSSPTNELLQAVGIDGVLSKPCDARELQGCLTRWCAPSAGAWLALSTHGGNG